MKIIKSTVVYSLLAVSAMADFTLSISFGSLFDSTGANPGINKVGALVVSTQGAAFPQGGDLAGLSLANGSSWGNGLFVMNVLSSVNVNVDHDGNAGTGSIANSIFAGTTANIVTNNFANLTVGDKLALYWFPAISDTNTGSGIQGAAGVTPSRAIQNGDKYGFYRTDTVQMGTFVANNTSFEVTALTGTAIRLQARNDASLTPAQEITVGAAPNPLDTDFQASLTVPEPSTYAVFAGVIALGLAFYRRRR